MLKQSILITVLLFSVGFGTLQAEPKVTTREFRPLMAKKVAVELAARVTPVADIDIIRNEAWTYFDSREWELAVDKFLTLLERKPASKEAAEGLAMSLYRSGDYNSAYRLGDELSEVMPELQTIVSEAVIADVRYMVKEGELNAAQEFLSNFPASDKFYSPAHALLVDANAFATGLGGTDEVVSTPGTKVVANN